MILEFFPMLLLGHLVGDYLLQHKWMAENKGRHTWPALLHCLVYTAVVSAFTFPFISGLWWSVFVFLTHFPIDRWSLGTNFRRWMGGMGLGEYLVRGRYKLPDNLPQNTHPENYHGINAALTTVCYIVADNTLHLLLMYLGACLLF